MRLQNDAKIFSGAINKTCPLKPFYSIFKIKNLKEDMYFHPQVQLSYKMGGAQHNSAPFELNWKYVFSRIATPQKTHFGLFSVFAPYCSHFAPYWGRPGHSLGPFFVASMVPSKISVRGINNCHPIIRNILFIILFITFSGFNTQLKNPQREILSNEEILKNIEKILVNANQNISQIEIRKDLKMIIILFVLSYSN